MWMENEDEFYQIMTNALSLLKLSTQCENHLNVKEFAKGYNLFIYKYMF